MEVAIEHWKNIARIFGISESKMRSYRDELLDGGFIFYRRVRNGNRVVCAFPSSLRVWAAWKGARREAI